MMIIQTGNNMAALPNVSQILHTEWQDYWSDADKSVLQNYGQMNTEEQKQLLTQFVRHHIPGKNFSTKMFRYSTPFEYQVSGIWIILKTIQLVFRPMSKGQRLP